MDISTQHVDPI